MNVIIYFLIVNSVSQKSFTLRNTFKKEFTLTKPSKHLNKDSYRFTSMLKNVLGVYNEKESHNEWYYVHFINDDYSMAQKYIDLNTKDKISKNTFALFLSLEQIEKISNISLIKKIEPSDKINVESESIHPTNQLIVATSSKYKLPEKDDLYIINGKLYEDIYIIQIDKNNLDDKEFINKKAKVIKFLSEIPEVKTISNYKKPDLKNSIISGFTQKNTFNFLQNKELGYFTTDRYMNNNGLKGENQVITIIDSPIDIYHAMFEDKKVPIEFNKYMPDHRKILYYKFNGTEEELKKQIENNEHGTHVSGTAAGKSNCQGDPYSISNFNGNAPESKILYAGSFEDQEEDEFTQLMKKYNSTISSNSWGSTDYEPMLNHFGNIISSENPESVFIFAAGNEYELLNGNFSVCDPGGSKNVLTVGALDHFYDYDNQYYTLINLDNQNQTYDVWSIITVADPWISGTVGTQPGKWNLLAIDISKGNQCKLLEDEKTIGLLYGEQSDWYYYCNYSSHSQVFYVGNEPELIKLLLREGRIFIVKNWVIDESKYLERASFSSTGPGYRGILKPDVMAPGSMVLSAKSREHSDYSHGCLETLEGDLVFMSGTSMATPNIAGAMSLVHQYFNSGKWIDNVQLDGATSRALLINSCQHPFNSKKPDIWYGHGVVDLSTILPIKGGFGVQITPQGIDDIKHRHSVGENGHVVAKILVNFSKSNQKKLQITMSYIDSVMNVDSWVPITRDLDLIVVSPSKELVFLGDHLENSDTQHASTNEKVIIDESQIEEGEYTIHVYGGEFADGGLIGNKKDFAIAATGPIDNGYIEFSDSDECPCDKCDPKRPGFCLCEGKENENVGQVCQAEVEKIKGKTGIFSVAPLRIKRVKFVLDKKITKIRAKSNHHGRDITIWASDKCHLSLGQYEVFGSTGDQQRDSITSVDFDSNEICVAIFNNNDVDAIYVIEVSGKESLNLLFIVTTVCAALVIILVIVIVIICSVKNPCKCCVKTVVLDSTTSQSLIPENVRNQI